MKTILLIAGFLLLFAVEILRVYFIMPFPGSQQSDTINVAYFLAKNTWWLRIVALLLIAFPAYRILKYGGRWKKVGLIFTLIGYVVTAYMIHFKMEADKMFYQPTNKHFADVNNSTIATDRLVVGVMLNGEAKAYPIQLIGYHHQVADTIGNTPVIVTYCTVCRTGRVYSPQVNGKNETFRLVGMDHFNAMFEDATTKSWWRQVNGEAITGPLKGTKLTEIPSEQMSLAAWQRKYPATRIMQRDTLYSDIYAKMVAYDKGLSKGDLTRRDTGSWQAKSWVVGIRQDNMARAYDWNQLIRSKLIEDSLPGIPLMITIEKDSASFHAFNREIDGQSLRFVPTANMGIVKDVSTGSLWNEDGKSIEGPMMGKQLRPLQVYQEFWHSWQTFHPGTDKFTTGKYGIWRVE